MPTYDVQAIQELLPHRYPFLLIDRIVEFEPTKRLVAIKNVTINEPFFQGHFPGYPIMPGVLVVEAMAQAGGMIMMAEIPDRDTKLVVFTDSGGQLHVLDGYCRHMGGDLSRGTVKGDAIACPFHDWRWGGDGRCAQIPYARRVPPAARPR